MARARLRLGLLKNEDGETNEEETLANRFEPLLNLDEGELRTSAQGASKSSQPLVELLLG